MKILKNNKWILTAVVLFLCVTCAYAYPPDNAAVLYYKAAVLYEIDDQMSDMLSDLKDSKIQVNDKIRESVNKNNRVINTLLDASEIKNCDWGMDFSQGIEMDLPPLGDIKRMTYLLLADAKILVADADYETAIDRCMSLYRMVRHVNDRNYISYLVGLSINHVTNDCLMQIMAEMPQDTKTLTWLKNQLLEIDSIPFSAKPAIFGERQAMLISMTPGQLPVVGNCGTDDKSVMEKILALDSAAIERNREYYKTCYTDVIAAYDMPYVEGYNLLTDVGTKIAKDAESDPDAILTSILQPAVRRIFSLKTRFETYNNAIKAAIELYLIKAQTGKLPDQLPASLPKDLFSGKDFGYEKTDDGFILRCQAKELGKDEVHEYQFKVK